MARLIDEDKAKEVLTYYYSIHTSIQRIVLEEAFSRIPTVEAIPIEWIKQWRKDKWFSKKPIEERIIMAMGVRLMLEEWEKENENS